MSVHLSAGSGSTPQWRIGQTKSWPNDAYFKHRKGSLLQSASNEEFGTLWYSQSQNTVRAVLLGIGLLRNRRNKPWRIRGSGASGVVDKAAHHVFCVTRLICATKVGGEHEHESAIRRFPEVCFCLRG
ncbi:MAG: hypothetical protein DMG40_26480 [Acidobacteria bacterium]|nr:MAG: hypothetical protein DMG40_26480 [Acidobacteriota bacterium]